MGYHRSDKYHNAVISDLENRLRSEDHQLFREWEYDYNGHHEADLLVLNFKRKYAYAIEVKTKNHKKARRHAYNQLTADENYINKRWGINRVFKFYAHKPKRKSKKWYEIKLINNK